ncbi:hypothetical protein [Phyllobacterium sp. YR531]|uniref:hypothetical protein n=1 Tax=Phyllobacterium sp. YR531 TaxID=1144343 RepID=UPI00026F4955|nr:hypothetical protein [Phyllobacterium sp. YR531]EJN04939.1 hypothetical protein PMI41_01405 [Phyllobacterium sp. YR531]
MSVSNIKRWPRIVATVLLSTAFLAGCASDIMKGYIGKPLESVVLDYGPPTNVIEMGPGRKAYQWRKINTNVVPGTSTEEVRKTRHGRTYQTIETPGYVQETECFYTFYADYINGRWYVIDFRKPKLECE